MKLKKVLLFAGSTFAAIMLTGCATIVSKSEYPITINTNATDATVTVRSASTGLVLSQGPAPLFVKLKANSGFFQGASYQCEVKTKKNRKQIRVLSAGVDPWIAGNLLVGGIIGLAVDGATGAMFKLDDSLYVHFSEYDK